MKNGKSEAPAPETPAEIFIVVFADGGITSFTEKRDAEAFRKSIKRETTLARYVVVKEEHR